MKDFCKVLQARRSVYGISDASPIPQEEICTLVKQAVLHTPSSFHMQSARAVLLFGSHHKKLWEITRDILGELVPAGQFSATEKNPVVCSGLWNRPFFRRDRDNTPVCRKIQRLPRQLSHLGTASQWNAAIRCVEPAGRAGIGRFLAALQPTD